MKTAGLWHFGSHDVDHFWHQYPLHLRTSCHLEFLQPESVAPLHRWWHRHCPSHFRSGHVLSDVLWGHRPLGELFVDDENTTLELSLSHDLLRLLWKLRLVSDLVSSCFSVHVFVIVLVFWSTFYLFILLRTDIYYGCFSLFSIIFYLCFVGCIWKSGTAKSHSLI